MPGVSNCLACGEVFRAPSQKLADAKVLLHESSCPILCFVRQNTLTRNEKAWQVLPVGPGLQAILKDPPNPTHFKAYLETLREVPWQRGSGAGANETMVIENGDGHYMIPLEDLRTFLRRGGKGAQVPFPALTSVEKAIETWLSVLVESDAVGESLRVAQFVRKTKSFDGRPHHTGPALIWATPDTVAGFRLPQFWHVDVCLPQAQVLIPLYAGSQSTMVYAGECLSHRPCGVHSSQLTFGCRCSPKAP